MSQKIPSRRRMSTEPIAGSRSRREDVAVPRDVATCSVCGRQRTRGVRDQTGEIFVCVGCQADAKKFIEIQDAIWDPIGGADMRAGELSNEAEKPDHP